MNKYLEKSKNGMVLTDEALERSAHSSLTTREGLAFMLGKQIVGVENVSDDMDGDKSVGIVLTLQDKAGALSIIEVSEIEDIGPGVFFDEVIIIIEEAQP